MPDQLTHLNNQGEAHMVDVGDKQTTSRTAIAESFVEMSPQALSMIIEGNHKKGDVFSVARIAGIQAAKKCADLIPLCHPLMLTKIDIQLEAQPQFNRVRIQATCSLSGKTGVEMEALTAASISALTIYDMCKAIDKGIVIRNTQLVNKIGGKSGDWSREHTNQGFTDHD